MNERCAKHSITRCGICNRPPKFTAPTSVPAPAAGFDPSFTDGPVATNGTIQAGPDAATLEAIQRNKEIAAKAAEAENPNALLSDESLPEPTETALEAARRVKATLEAPYSLAQQARVFPNAIVLPANPIVDAAKEYAQAQREVELRMQNVASLKEKLGNAELMLEEAVGDRNMKKEVLQKLVAS